jgi:hypothetical protein
MMCCTASVRAAAVVAFFASFVGLGSASASAGDFQNYSPATLPPAHFADGVRSDTFAAVRESMAPLRLRDSTGYDPPLTSHQQGRGERQVSGCGWSASRHCDKSQRLGSMPRSMVPASAAAWGIVVANTHGRSTEGVVPYKLIRIASVSGQPSLASPDRIGKVSPAAGAPLSRPTDQSRERSLGISASSANEESAPGPYAILIISISLAAFMAFRRMGQV